MVTAAQNNQKLESLVPL